MGGWARTVWIVAAFAAFALLLRRVDKNFTRRRERESLEALERFGAQKRRDLLRWLDRYFRDGPYQLSYWPDDTGPLNPYARIGGDPLALLGQQWPEFGFGGKPAVFVLQLALQAPRLPAQWMGRLLSVFLQKRGFHVRSYAPGARDSLVPLARPAGHPAVRECGLRELALPYIAPPDDGSDPLELTPEYLMQHNPGLRADMARFPKPGKMLNTLLLGQATWMGGLPYNTILCGGDPVRIQGEHPAICPECQQPMRFLLQFPDVTVDLLMGDAGFGYVYGCDTHPERCLGFWDCH